MNETMAKQVASMFKEIPIRRLLQGVDLAANKDISVWREFKK
jgi:hypothetical protein